MTEHTHIPWLEAPKMDEYAEICLLYTSDAADE